MYQNLNQIYNILYSEHLIYDLYVCTYVFLLHHKSFDIILHNNLSFYDEGVTKVGMSMVFRKMINHHSCQFSKGIT
jgi:hypothetical protein